MKAAASGKGNIDGCFLRVWGKERIGIREWMAMGLCLLAWVLLLPFLTGTGVAEAAGYPVKIASCSLTSAGRLVVEANAKTPQSLPGKECGLFALPVSSEKPTSGRMLLKKVKTGSHMVFRVSLSRAKLNEIIDSRFVIAARTGKNAWKAVSSVSRISNPERAALYHYTFPTGQSKKGLQMSSDLPEDSQELNIQHGLINVVLSDILATGSSCNSQYAIPYKYAGKTYWMKKSEIESYDRQLNHVKSNGAVNSAVLLMMWRSDTSYLIAPEGRRAGQAFYAWNTRETQGKQALQAILTFLAERYSPQNGEHGRIVNWIVANEVNDPYWYYSGNVSMDKYVQLYTEAMRLTHSVVSSVYSNARVYISLNHLWNYKDIGAYTARSMLERFAATVNKTGYFPWNIAYHPYSSPLTEPRFWKNENHWTTQDVLTTPVINMNNISLLTRFVKKHYGEGCRIILSEQGYTSVQDKKKMTEKEQTAAIVYSYYLTEANDMIDSFIMNRHVDNMTEVAQGLNLGIWTTSGWESAERKKDSWNAFKYMDTAYGDKLDKSTLKTIGAKSWDDLIEDYTPKLHDKVKLLKGKLEQVQGYQNGKQIPRKWTAYGPSSMTASDKDLFSVQRRGGTNKNRLWGFAQVFSKPLNVKKQPVMYVTVRAQGETSGSVQIKLRLYSGKKIFECERTIPCGQQVALRVSLDAWKGKGAISRMYISVSRAGGSWQQGAKLTMGRIRMAKS